jgi:hypothetical protein
MLIIHANINRRVPRFIGDEALSLQTFCKAYGIKLIINVSDTELLESLVNTYTSDTILLFSNFPPDSSYPGCAQKDQAILSNPEWNADTYEKSITFFKKLTRLDAIKALHIVTGAPKEKLSDAFMTQVFSHVKFSIKRNWEINTIKRTYASYSAYMKQVVGNFLNETS